MYFLITCFKNVTYMTYLKDNSNKVRDTLYEGEARRGEARRDEARQKSEGPRRFRTGRSDSSGNESGSARRSRLLSAVTSGRGQRTQGRRPLSFARRPTLRDVIHMLSTVLSGALGR